MKTLQIVTGFWGLVISLFLCFAISITYYDRERDKVPRALQYLMLVNAGLQISDMLALYYAGDASRLGCFMTRSANYVYFLMVAFLGVYFGNYFRSIIEWLGLERKKIFSKITGAISFLIIVLLTINLFTGWFYRFTDENFYQRTKAFGVVSGLQLLLLFSIMLGIYHYRKTKIAGIVRFHLTAFGLIMVIGIYQTFVYGMSLISIAFTLALIVFYIAHLTNQAEHLQQQMKILEEQKERLAEQQEELRKKELELNDTQEELAQATMRLLTAQIKPHFIYNTITMIRSLCYTDAEGAAESLAKFAKFLRGSMNFLGAKNSIMLQEELGIVRSYVFLQRKRFGERLIFHENIEAVDCFIPAMSLQILVENAIIHGIEGRDEGGEIWLHTCRENNETIITVQDNGNGFDTSVPIDEQKHYGLAAVRKRLMSMCGGTLEMTSTVGEGTTALVRIPDRE